MSEKNPFTVLGFAPTAFQGLSDQDIRNLVKGQYRLLATIHHPDRRGNSERFKDVQEAFNKLEEDFEFDFWKNSFLRKRKDHVAELEKELRQTTAKADELHRSLVDFWLAYCRGTLIFECSPLVRHIMKMEGFSIFNPPAVSLIMTDRLAELLNKQAAEERYKAGVKLKIWDEESNSTCFELRISPGEIMTKQKLVKTYFDPREEWRPTVRRELIELRDRPFNRSYYWKPEGEPVAVTGALIGSFPSRVFSDYRIQQAQKIKGFIQSGVKPEDYKILERGYSLDEFEPYLRFIRSRVMNSSLVVVVEGNEEHNLRFKILGYVRKILTPC